MKPGIKRSAEGDGIVLIMGDFERSGDEGGASERIPRVCDGVYGGRPLPKILLEIHLRLCASFRQMGQYTQPRMYTYPSRLQTAAESKTLRTFQFKVSKIWISPA